MSVIYRIFYNYQAQLLVNFYSKEKQKGMPSVINYRFRSYKDYSIVTFEGASMPLWELKYEIIAQRKMTSKDFDLLFFDAETNEPITDDYGPVHRNSYVVVHRVPAWMSKPSFEVKEKKVEDIPKRSSRDPPENYVCFRCGNKGHFIQHCPTNNDKNFDVVKVRKPSGIPRDFLEKVENTAGSSGAVLVTDKGFVRACPQTQVWKKQGMASLRIGNIPSYLRCGECSGLLSRPIVTDCGHTFCDGCVHVDERCKVCSNRITRVTPNERTARQVSDFLEHRV